MSLDFGVRHRISGACFAGSCETCPDRADRADGRVFGCACACHSGGAEDAPAADLGAPDERWAAYYLHRAQCPTCKQSNRRPPTGFEGLWADGLCEDGRPLAVAAVEGGDG